MHATFHRIPRYSRAVPAGACGEWAVRIEGGSPKAGDRVEIETRTGKPRVVTLGRIYRRWAAEGEQPSVALAYIG